MNRERGTALTRTLFCPASVGSAALSRELLEVRFTFFFFLVSGNQLLWNIDFSCPPTLFPIHSARVVPETLRDFSARPADAV